MKRSFSNQYELDIEAETATLESPPISVDNGQTERTERADYSGLNVSADLFAATSKRAARMNARVVPQREIDDLLRERQMLLDKEFDETITREEELRLQYVNWNLDRIEDAHRGAELDELEEWVIRYEEFQRELAKFETDLARQKKGSRR